MKWRVVMEVTGADGAVRVHEIGGSAPIDEYSPRTIGLTLAEGKLVLAGLQHHLVQAQTDDHCCRRRRCQRCGTPRPIKDQRSRRLLSLFGTVKVSAPRFKPCRCAVTRCRTLSPVSEIMPDRCTPEYERIVAKMGASLPSRRARTLLSEFFPLDDVPSVETARQRTIHVGARLEKEAVTSANVAGPTSIDTKSIVLSIDGGHVRSARQYQGRSFEVLLAQVTNDDGEQIVFSSVPAEAISQRDQLRGVLHKLGATAATPATILSDGAEGPRALGEAASPGPTRHVLDWFHLSMRIQHVDQATKSWPAVSADDRRTGTNLVGTIDRIRWRLWHGQVARALDLIGETLVTLDGVANGEKLAAVAARKVARLLRDLETYVCEQSDIIIDYATARRQDEPISTAVTESTVQWLLHSVRGRSLTVARDDDRDLFGRQTPFGRFAAPLAGLARHVGSLALERFQNECLVAFDDAGQRLGFIAGQGSQKPVSPPKRRCVVHAAPPCGFRGASSPPTLRRNARGRAGRSARQPRSAFASPAARRAAACHPTKRWTVLPLRAIDRRNPEWTLAPDRRSTMIQRTGADAMWIIVAGRYRTGGADAAKRAENLLAPDAT